ncbi:glucose-1-phosphate adenylyltransferase family protein [Deinococcus peraridilitoris]|uniref:ADP-glucose pyrophosphorylase n=1 Tax=Deinococcus peraridilitoris (strain DSM 19664 / LMG 22246 / CIP 109416 / KR-200) TaxID=937777 RepID=K9ZZT8_DEIPD|nr:glucose-1-phosphate adenylyltransferase family protein [Deinococcus peraridilitoris]AFZ66285.1 ADP-glucose pyrophosphorylase [Deinococcus peraridilitoris DSM 19664]
MKTRMAGQTVLTLILAGGKGKRMGVLTEGRAKPVMPFAGVYRLIDFALSNCAHSGLSDVWVLEQYELHSLNDHLSSGRPWDLDRTHGGLQVLPPYQGQDDQNEQGSEGEAFAHGNAHALFLNRHLIREFAPDVVLVLSADHVYLLDYAEVVQRHLQTRASVTMVTTQVPVGETAHRFGNVTVNGEGRVTGFAYKPEEPISDLVTTEVFVYDATTLLDRLEELARRHGDLQDFGDELLPDLVQGGRAFAHRFEGYWRDVGTPQAYWEAHMQLVDGEIPSLDAPSWPLLTFGVPRAPARIEGSARIIASLLSPGSRVAGHVERSVLAPGVVIEAGASVHESVLLSGTVVRVGARVERAIVDEDCEIGAGAVVGGSGELTLVGQGAQIKANSHIEPGQSLPARERFAKLQTFKGH